MTFSQSDPYANASFVRKLQQTGTMVLSDQDGTNTVNSSDVDSPQELVDREAACNIMEVKGVATGTVSARTKGLTISEAMRVASKKFGFDEPEPLWGKDRAGTHVYVDPAKVPFFRHSLDRDISACFGSGIIVRNDDAYMTDWQYDNLLNYDYVRGVTQEGSPEPWRQAFLAALMQIYPLAVKHMAPMEYRSNYEKGVTNVAPLRYRIQFDFKGEEGLEHMRKLQEIIQEGALTNRLLARIAMVDESNPNRADPSKSKYTLYLIPHAASKERMINWLVDRCTKAARISPRDLKLFYAGDTLTDLRAGLYGGGQAETTFLLATGSRVAPYILERQPMFGNETLDFLWSSSARPLDRLRPTGEKGIYTFNLSGGFKKPNRIIIGDERYPGRTPPGSIAAFLEEFV